MNTIEIQEELTYLRGQVYKYKCYFDEIIENEDNEDLYMNKVNAIIKDLKLINSKIKKLEYLLFKNNINKEIL